jgi:hypothetical protein
MYIYSYITYIYIYPYIHIYYQVYYKECCPKDTGVRQIFLFDPDGNVIEISSGTPEFRRTREVAEVEAGPHQLMVSTMGIYIYMSICICIHVCMCLCIYDKKAYLYVCICVSMCIYVYIHIYIEVEAGPHQLMVSTIGISQDTSDDVEPFY